VTKSFLQTIGLVDDPAGLQIVVDHFIKGIGTDQLGLNKSTEEIEIISKVEEKLLISNGTRRPFLYASSQNCTEMIVYGSKLFRYY